MVLEGNSKGQVAALFSALKSRHRSLEVNYQKLGRIAPDIGLLRSLEKLVLKGNLLKELPDEIRALKQLKYLNLGDNCFETISEGILELRRLTVLHVFNNNLKTISPNIKKLFLLVTLNLSNNNLEQLPPELSRLRELETLALQGNLLRKIPSNLFDLPKLQVLKLGGNKLCELPITLGRCMTLRELYAENNQLTEMPSSVGNLKSLRKLELSMNDITVFPESIVDLRHIQEFWFDSNPMFRESQRGKTHLRPSPWSLKELCLRKCYEEDINLADISKSDHEKILYQGLKCLLCDSSLVTEYIEAIHWTDLKDFMPKISGSERPCPLIIQLCSWECLKAEKRPLIRIVYKDSIEQEIPLGEAGGNSDEEQ
eukprot:Nk52_evm20s236 gene=Nk52_evmTU20s236